MKNRKSNILETSRILFNKQGYSNVTIRMIALDLKISSGNLNYHFKKREDILEALYFEMVSEFDERVKNLGKEKITLKSIQRDMYVSMERMVLYRFFWTDLYNLIRLNSTIKTHFYKAYKDRLSGYDFLFIVLLDNGILQNFKIEKQRYFLMERMIDYSNTWIYNSFLYEKKINKEYIEQQSYSLLSMLYPYFTDLGKNEFKNIKPGYFS